MRKDNLSRRDMLKMLMISVGAFFVSCMPRRRVGDSLSMSAPGSTNTQAPATNLPTQTLTPTQTPEPPSTPSPSEIPCFRLLTPENGATLPAMGKITFSWQPMPGAARYHLQITLPGGKLLAIDTPTTSITRYTDTFLESGVYTWQVLALNGNGQVLCLTEPCTFQKPTLPTPDKGGNDDKRGDDSSDSGDDGPGVSGTDGTSGGG